MENPFKGRHFQADIILICTRCYLRYALSYRDIEEMMTERSLSVDHTTIYRWVQEYAPELDKRSRPYLKQTNDSWRVDETYVKVKGSGCICIELWIRQGKHWISTSARGAPGERQPNSFVKQ